MEKGTPVDVGSVWVGDKVCNMSLTPGMILDKVKLKDTWAVHEELWTKQVTISDTVVR